MAIIALPFGAGNDAPARVVHYDLVREQTRLASTAGVTQITSYPSRLWQCRVEIPELAGDDLRLWTLAIRQLSDITNRFALVPPEYEGPSTGYSATVPLVNGASQLGLTLAVDGLSASTAILKTGDYCSFDVTSAGGQTNRQLNQVTADVTSNGSGQATFPLLIPIRQAPADNTQVEIAAPSALFHLAEARGGVRINESKVSPISLAGVELVFP